MKIIFNDDLEKHFHNLGEYNRYNSILSERLNEHFKHLNENMINVLYNLDDIAKDLDLMYRLNKKVNSVSF